MRLLSCGRLGRVVPGEEHHIRDLVESTLERHLGDQQLIATSLISVQGRLPQHVCAHESIERCVYPPDVSEDDLAKDWTLSDDDRAEIGKYI